MGALTNKSIAPIKPVTFVVAPVGVSATAGHGTTTPTNTTLIASGGAAATRLTSLKGTPRITSAAGRALLFRSKDGGTTKHYVGSRSFTAYAAFNTTTDPTQAQMVDFNLSELAPRLLESANDQIYIGFSVAQPDGWVFEAEGGEYGVAP